MQPTVHHKKATSWMMKNQKCHKVKLLAFFPSRKHSRPREKEIFVNFHYPENRNAFRSHYRSDGLERMKRFICHRPFATATDSLTFLSSRTIMSFALPVAYFVIYFLITTLLVSTFCCASIAKNSSAFDHQNYFSYCVVFCLPNL